MLKLPNIQDEIADACALSECRRLAHRGLAVVVGNVLACVCVCVYVILNENFAHGKGYRCSRILTNLGNVDNERMFRYNERLIFKVKN